LALALAWPGLAFLNVTHGPDPSDIATMQLQTVDAFASAPFTGNPAAVCILDAPRSPDWMQKLAAELNLSETAFLVPAGEVWQLRWFTPAVEVDLCGHATLASAHTLWETGRLGPTEKARFETRSGRLEAVRDGDEVVMDFPAESPQPADPPDGLIEALGVHAVAVARNRMDYLIEVADEAAVRSIRPDLGRLRGVEARGVIVTALAADESHDFVSRFFAPRVGVDEDPVTGSAHCCLSPYWSAKLGRATLRGYQASPRGGTVGVTLDGQRVRLRGRAITILRCEIAEQAR
jgi:PhzF family phenazine biosynthesis protein